MDTDDKPKFSEVFLRLKGEIEGPYSIEDIKELLLRNDIPPSTFARHQDDDKWRPVSILLEPLESSSLPAKPCREENQRRVKSVRNSGFVFIVLIFFGFFYYSILGQHSKAKSALYEIKQREITLSDSLNKKTKELENLNLKLIDLTDIDKDNVGRIQRLSNDLDEVSRALEQENKKSSILLNLSQALATDQQMVRESLLPAIGIESVIFLSVIIDPGLLEIKASSIRAAMAGPLTTAGFKVVFEAPKDRGYLWANYRLTQISNTQAGFAAFSAKTNCYGLSWQSGSVRPTILFSEQISGYAGKNSNYSKSIIENATMFGEMLADSLGKLDRDALTVNYNMLDPDAELVEASVKLRELTNTNDKPVAATGTGFIVSPKGLIITNHHVVDGHEQVEVWIPATDKKLLAQVIGVDKNNDLAFLRLSEVNSLPASLVFPIIAKTLPEVGQTVFTVGFPIPEIMGREPKFSQGIVNALSGFGNNTRVLQHSIPIQPGNSGGLLVSDSGEICGVVASMLNAKVMLEEAGMIPQNVNYAIKSERLWDFASSQKLTSELNENGGKPIKVQDGISLSVLITTHEK